MIDAVIFAKSRDDLVAATQALDRVLLWNHYVVPQWTYPYVRIARWDRFGHPDPLPKYARIRVPDGVVVGRRQGGQDGIAFVIVAACPTRRRALALAAGAAAGFVALPLASVARPRRRRDRVARPLGVRRSRLSGRLPTLSLCRSERAEGRQLFADRTGPAIQPEFSHLQFAQQLHPQRRRGAGHGAHLRHADGALRRRAGRHVRPRRREGAALRRRPHLPILHPPAGEIPRRLAADRPRRRLLAQYPERERPSADQPVAARFCRRQGRRRCERDRKLRAEARPRRAAVRRRPADFFARLLHDKAVR